MNKNTNIHYLSDKIDIYKKMITNEYAHENFVNSTNLSNERIVKNIKDICLEIKRRVNSIYHYKHKTIVKGVELTKETDMDKQNISKN